jgi:hypothetical protein
MSKTYKDRRKQEDGIPKHCKECKKTKKKKSKLIRIIRKKQYIEENN